MYRLACTALLTFAYCFLFAQKLEHHDRLLFILKQNAAGLYQPTAPRFLTAFNALGYNNQPAFFSPSEIYLTVQSPADTSQTDILALDLGLRTATRVTATRESEYSPTPIPNSRRFSVVRVEEDGSQRLWSLPLDRSDTGRPLFSDLHNVGYHCWLRDTVAALFLVGETPEQHSLVLAGLPSQWVTRVATNVGRCLRKLPDGRLAFIQKVTAQTWFLKTYDPARNALEVVTRMLPGSEDFTLLPNGAYLTGSGARLYQYQPGVDADWRLVADWGRYGVKHITRLAVSEEGKLVVVVQ